MAEPITIDELLAAMEAASQSNNTTPGMTTLEIANALGWGIDKTRRHLRAAFTAGKIKSTRRRVVAINGAPAWASVYYPVKQLGESTELKKTTDVNAATELNKNRRVNEKLVKEMNRAAAKGGRR